MTIRPRLRILRTAAVLVLLGAVVNVLVAWGCVIAAPATLRPAVARPTESDSDALFPYRSRVKEIKFHSTGSQCLGLTRIDVAAVGIAELSESFSGGVVFDRGVVWRAGLPWRGLSCAQRPRFATVIGGVRVQVPSGVDRPFPCVPIWPAFAINTGLHTVILTTGFLGFRWLRHRRLFGCCRSCRYDLSGITSGVCPECGAEA